MKGQIILVLTALSTSCTTVLLRRSSPPLLTASHRGEQLQYVVELRLDVRLELRLRLLDRRDIRRQLLERRWRDATAAAGRSYIIVATCIILTLLLQNVREKLSQRRDQ